VRRRTLGVGLITPEQAGGISEQQLAWLVFAPGFSTVETVTNVPGRGVGLDVVRTNIGKIGGAVDLQSGTGEGTALHFTIPLTLAILPVLLVSSGGQRFAVPQANLIEAARLEGGMGASSIERVCDVPVFRLHDGLLPLCFLDQELHLEPSCADGLHVVVLQAGAGQVGLVVDAVHDTEEIVVKPLGPQLRGLVCFAGAAILGEGHVVLILDAAAWRKWRAWLPDRACRRQATRHRLKKHVMKRAVAGWSSGARQDRGLRCV
jgi:two-component system chemotaxis sensor kinase CheA